MVVWGLVPLSRSPSAIGIGPGGAAPGPLQAAHNGTHVWPLPMTVLLLVALGWLGLRTALLLAQAARHTPEAQLGRAFQQELRDRGLSVESRGR